MADPDDLYREALDRWGPESQLRMLQEECAEAIVAVNKLDRAKGPLVRASAISSLAEEIADVEIMCEQARLIVDTELVDGYKAAKLSRLRERLDVRRVLASEWHTPTADEYAADAARVARSIQDAMAAGVELHPLARRLMEASGGDIAKAERMVRDAIERAGR